MKRSGLLFIFLLIATGAQSQKLKIRGTLTDRETGEPLPYVGISLKGTTVGTMSEFDGEYYLETRTRADTVYFSTLGYEPLYIPIGPGNFHPIDTSLAPQQVELDEVVVRPGKNPALKILDSLEKHRDINYPPNVNSYQYESYTKIQVDLNDISEEDLDQPGIREFAFVRDYIDTSAITGKAYLPIYLSENLSEYYYREAPRKEVKRLKASRTSGMENRSFLRFTEDLYLRVNFYDAYIKIFERNFVCPTAGFGPLYYQYYLLDSTVTDTGKSYHISFEPLRSREPTFTGDMWIEAGSWALKEIKVRIADDVNINFVTDMVIEHEYTKPRPCCWVLGREYMFADFVVVEGEPGINGHKTTVYRNYRFDAPPDSTITNKPKTSLGTSLPDMSDEQWQEARHEKLSRKEEKIHEMVDSIKQVPLYNTLYDIAYLVVNGHYVVGLFEFGPIYTFYSYNPIEGKRFRLGGQTSNDFSTRLMFDYYLAYGTKDEDFKYGLGTMYMFSTEPRRSFRFFYHHDLEQLGLSHHAFLRDNILSSLLRRRENYKLAMVDGYMAYYEHEWTTGFSNTIKINNRHLQSPDNDYLDFYREQNGQRYDIERIITTELNLNTRWAYDEKFLSGHFERTSLGTDYPIINLNLSAGLHGILDGDYEYYRVNLNVEHTFPIGVLGNMNYMVDAGKYYGSLPYPLLQVHAGNETYAYNRYLYNLMNYYEFVSDQYLSLYIENHFNGLLFNNIPFLNRLKWREVASAKAVIGTLDDKHRTRMTFPDGLTSLAHPYYEAGVGIENILRFIRVDARWRLNYFNHSDAPHFGVFMMLDFRF